MPQRIQHFRVDAVDRSHFGLHFGYNDPLLARQLCETLNNIGPDVLVISGDLVEHATAEEFIRARDFIAQLPGPQIIVPGNHDLPFYNLWRRWTEGLKIYSHFITENVEPALIDDVVAILGASSAHLFPVKGGKITEAQLDVLVERFSSFPSTLIRILVTHHPFDLPEPSNPHLLIGHSRRAVAQLGPVVDLLLAGHVHVSSSGSTSTRYKLGGEAMVFVQAGTAISDRHKLGGRNELLQYIARGPHRDGRKASYDLPLLVVQRESAIRKNISAKSIAWVPSDGLHGTSWLTAQHRLS